MEHVESDMVETFETNANSCAAAAAPKIAFFNFPGQAQNEGSGKETAGAKISSMLFNASDSSSSLGMGFALVKAI